MITKLIAAELATAAGVTTIITHGSKPKNIFQIIDTKNKQTIGLTTTNDSNNNDIPLHTEFTAKNNPMIDRKWWILHGLHTAGTIYIDSGAAKAVISRHLRSSLFAAGIVDVGGVFNAQQAVRICLRKQTEDGKYIDIDIGKGLANYSSTEISRIKRCKSSDIPAILGYVNADCVIHRDNLVRTAQEDQIL